MLRALAAGDGSTFAAGFTRSGYFAPFGGRVEAVGRGRIAAIVNGLRSEIWGAHTLLPPRGTAGLPATAVYGLQIDVFHRGRLFRNRAAKVVVSCVPGRVSQWVGPNVPR